MKVTKILVAGAGITGCVIACELQRLAKIAGNHAIQITIWEKSRGPGGRMTTSRAPENRDCYADIGAQYISVSNESRGRFSRLYDQLENEGLLVEMQAKIEGTNPYASNDVKELVCPLGSSAIVKHFLEKSGAELKTECFLASVNTAYGNKFHVKSKSGFVGNDVDLIILTMPVPQIFLLQGDAVSSHNFDELRRKHPVEYSSRYALALFFPELCDVGLDFGFKFLDDDVLRYIDVDNVKRNQKSKPAAVVMHSTWQFGQQYLEESPEKAEKIMLKRFYELFPAMPQTSIRKIHKWRYSQARIKDSNTAANHGYHELRPGIFCAGDGFTYSSLDGCFESATRVSEAVFRKVVSES